MLQAFQRLRERWENWCGDRDMELQIRQHLTANGYFGRTAQLKRVRLIAIQRPGWLQIFRFEVTARVAHPEREDGPDPPAEYRDLYGLVREDARRGTSVRVFEDADLRGELYREWAEGLIQLRGAQGLQSSTSPQPVPSPQHLASNEPAATRTPSLER